MKKNATEKCAWWSFQFGFSSLVFLVVGGLTRAAGLQLFESGAMFAMGWLVCGILAVVLAITTLIRIRNNPDQLEGKGLAIAGLVCGCFPVSIFLFGIIYN